MVKVMRRRSMDLTRQFKFYYLLSHMKKATKEKMDANVWKHTTHSKFHFENGHFRFATSIEIKWKWKQKQDDTNEKRKEKHKQVKRQDVWAKE